MDAFYASVEEREHPEIAQHPVIVGGNAEGRGVVCAANYRARKFGVHSAMPTSTAVRLCPNAIVLQPRMSFYAEVSAGIREIFHRYTDQVEPLSLDEAFLDATGSEQIHGRSEQIGRKIKDDIRRELNLIASVGVAPNKFLAKLASDLEKPDGFTVIPKDQIQQILDPLPVRRIWGVGKATEAKMARLGLHTIADLRGMHEVHLRQEFGRQGEQFFRLARGIDDRRVVPDREAKSVSRETTFSEDLRDHGQLLAWALELTEHVASQLRRSKIYGRTVNVKIRYSDFRTMTRSFSLNEATNSTQAIWTVARRLIDKELSADPSPIRLLGVGVSQLQRSENRQLSLFPEETPVANQPVDQLADQIRKKFGATALRRGSTVEHSVQHRHLPKPNE